MSSQKRYAGKQFHERFAVPVLDILGAAMPGTEWKCEGTQYVGRAPYRTDNHPSLKVDRKTGCFTDWGTDTRGGLLKLLVLANVAVDIASAAKWMETRGFLLPDAAKAHAAMPRKVPLDRIEAKQQQPDGVGTAVERLATRWRTPVAGLHRMGGRPHKNSQVWFPHRAPDGSVKSWQRRSADAEHLPCGTKSKNTGGRRGIMGRLPRKGDHLLVICEGERDGARVLSLLDDHEAVAVVALPGAAPDGGQLDHLVQMASEVADVVVMLDQDAKGREATLTIIRRLPNARVVQAWRGDVKDIDQLLLMEDNDAQRRIVLDALLKGAAVVTVSTPAADHQRGQADTTAPTIPGTTGTAGEQCWATPFSSQRLLLTAEEHADESTTETKTVEAETFDANAAVLVGPNEHQVTNQVIAIMAANDPLLFKCGGNLVTIAFGDPKTPPRIIVLNVAGVRDRITRTVELARVQRDGMELCNPPKWLAESITARRDWPDVPALAGIVESPVLRPDGTILDQEGFDPATSLFLNLTAQFPAIPSCPTHAQAQAAARRLLDLVSDFPMEDTVAESVFLALLLTLVGRDAIAGPTPLFVVDGNLRGVGKTLLASVPVLIATNRMPALKPAPQTDEEFRKSITAALLEGERIAFFDNVVGDLGCASLDRALTGNVWSDRPLGTSTTATVPLNMTWIATANNATLTADTVRRALTLRLESTVERPEDRHEFKHPDLVGHIQENRASLYMDSLLLLRAYLAAGKPSVNVQAMGSFGAWRNLVAATVVWLGWPDPIASVASLKSAGDPDRNILLAVFAELDRCDPSHAGVMASQLAASDDATWRDAMEAAIPGGMNPRRLGKLLSRLARRPVDGRRLIRRTYNGGTLWAVQDIAATNAA